MSLKLRVYAKYIVIDFREEDLNSLNFDQVKSQLKQMVDMGFRNVIVNLSKVEYMGSMGLNILVSLQKMCLAEDGELRICCPSHEVDTVMFLTGVDRLIKVFYSENDAKSYQPPDRFVLEG